EPAILAGRQLLDGRPALEPEPVRASGAATTHRSGTGHVELTTTRIVMGRIGQMGQIGPTSHVGPILLWGTSAAVLPSKPPTGERISSWETIMKRAAGWVMVLGGVFFLAALAQAGGAALEALQGDWLIVSIEKDGTKTTFSGKDQPVITFKGEAYQLPSAKGF